MILLILIYLGGIWKMDSSTELIEALNQIVKEKGIDADVIFEAIETSLVTACKKNYGNNEKFKVIINREKGTVECYAQKEVVDEVSDLGTEINIKEAKELSHYYEIGDIVDIPIKPKNFGRIAAQTAKQVVVQKFREAERNLLYNEYVNKEKEIVTGIVQRRDRKNVIIALGKIDAVLTPAEQIPGEQYDFQTRLKLYVTEVKQTSKGPIINVSRTHPELIKRLFEQEVPEIFDGTVEIKGISREAGSRSKISVFSKNPDVDAVGSCVGQNGCRVNIIVSELKGEKIDIINWSPNPKEFIESSLSPSKVISVDINEENKSAKVIVPQYQLSLAIGKEGQNVRLAAKLTGWKIDIKSDVDEGTLEVDNDENIEAYKSFYENEKNSLSYNLVE